MKDPSGTNRELVEEISDLRQRIKELEQSEVIHKQTEKTLRKFRSRVEATNDWVWEINNEGFYTYSSPKIRDLLGYEPQEVIGKTPFDLMPKGEADRVAPLFKEIIESRQSFSGLENKNLHKDGREIVLETSGAPIIDAEGNFVGYRGIDRDVTERKKAEEALLESEAKYRAVVESSLVGVFIVQDNLFRFVNKRWCEIYGYTYDEVVDKVCPLDLAHPEDKRIIQENVRKRLSGEAEHAEYEARVFRKDGTIITVKVLGSLILYKGRQGASGTVIDVTEHRKAEEQLRQKTALLEAQLNASPDGILIADKGRKTLQNQRVNDLLKIPKHIAESDDIEIWIEWTGGLARNPEEFHERLSHRLANPDETMHDEFTLKDGTVLDRYSSPVIGEDGKRYGRLITFRDISERKRSEEEKARLEAQLFQSQKMEAIGTLTGGIAHDFNNILTALTGYASLLRMKMAQEDPLRVYVEHVLSASGKAADLVKSLLAFSRLQTINISPVGINSIIKGSGNLLQRLLTEDIVFRMLLSPDDTTIMADIIQIDQILFNLTANARDAMPRGGTLTIETRIVELDNTFKHFHGYGEPGTYALLSVSDTGSGMDEETLKRIFDPFFTTKEVGKGTGLGLSTVYGIVKQHKGYINAYSEPGLGTTFHVYLPVANTIGKEDESNPAPVRGGNETIMVAEDNDAVRDLMKAVLTEYGYSVIEAVDGEDAIDQFTRANGIDLIILDTVMPKKNGLEVYEEILKIKPDSKVIFTSGYTRDVILDKGLEDKRFTFIPKPISPYALLQKVRHVLDDNGDPH
jgi:two-component system, cell cycle sensor histidine kinase and response regulator CckA